MSTVFDGFRSQLNASENSIAGVKQYIERLAKRPVEHFSLTHTLAGSHVAGLIIHDKEDNEIPHGQSLLLHQVWPGSKLYYTRGLGHRRILRDNAAIAQVVDFVRGDRALAAPRRSFSLHRLSLISKLESRGNRADGRSRVTASAK